MIPALRTGLVPSHAEGLSRRPTHLAIQAEHVEVFDPVGAERTHVGFRIHGIFWNIHEEDPVELPPIYFRIRKIDPNSPGSRKELLVALTALNQFIDQHKHMTRADFGRHIASQHGKAFFFGIREDVDSELNPVDNDPKLSWWQRPIGWINKNVLNKRNIVNSMRFYAPDVMLTGGVHARSKRTKDEYENEHFVSEFTKETKAALEEDARDLPIKPMSSPAPETGLVFEPLEEDEYVVLDGRGGPGSDEEAVDGSDYDPSFSGDTGRRLGVLGEEAAGRGREMRSWSSDSDDGWD